MSDTQEPTKDVEPANETKPEPKPEGEPVKPDVITNIVDDTAIKELTKSLNDLKQVQKAIYEQQNLKTQREEKQNGKKIYY